MKESLYKDYDHFELSVHAVVVVVGRSLKFSEVSGIQRYIELLLPCGYIYESIARPAQWNSVAFQLLSSQAFTVTRHFRNR